MYPTWSPPCALILCSLWLSDQMLHAPSQLQSLANHLAQVLSPSQKLCPRQCPPRSVQCHHRYAEYLVVLVDLGDIDFSRKSVTSSSLRCYLMSYWSLVWVYGQHRITKITDYVGSERAVLGLLVQCSNNYTIYFLMNLSAFVQPKHNTLVVNT
jgi:hypothetical protein